MTAPLVPGVTYTFAVRARDPHGALSPWSDPETFTVAMAGTVTVNGTPATNLRSAVAAAVAGDVVALGAGTFPLSDTLHVGGGVSVRGASAGRTTIDATGLAVGVSFDGTDPKTPAALDKTTVTGAATCVDVSGTATGVQLTHLIVRDCATAGIHVAAGGSAAIANATLVAERDGRRFGWEQHDQEQPPHRRRRRSEERGVGRALEQLRRSLREHDAVPGADGGGG